MIGTLDSFHVQHQNHDFSETHTVPVTTGRIFRAIDSVAIFATVLTARNIVQLAFRERQKSDRSDGRLIFTPRVVVLVRNIDVTRKAPTE